MFMAKDGTPHSRRDPHARDPRRKGRLLADVTVSRDMRKLKKCRRTDSRRPPRRHRELAAGVVARPQQPLTAVILASTVMKKMADMPGRPTDQMREQTALYCETITESARPWRPHHAAARLCAGVKEQHTP
jgi:hypothetical protein